ncbi:hypothetical protein KIN20_037142 [Parelaphostrongylus tenuis]|uniref:C2H2-type domain-containing protein n=1 Tax=Parelaphostrongylus tenuis TaxID=148309 RepID=A0AAD5WM81_PARTN|nr:hypothetical protein KIN20_037142 [Parelaphostrongylus tenuis]
MGRRSVRKRSCTPDPGAVGTSSSRPSADSDGDEIIDVETIPTAHIVDVETTSLCDNGDEAILKRLPPRMEHDEDARRHMPFISARSTPRITLVGRGRPESFIQSIVTTDPQKLCSRKHSNTSETGPRTPSKRVPILADEGIGTFAVTKLPLEEMTMSTKVLRAIQEDHNLSKVEAIHDEEVAEHESDARDVREFPTNHSEPSTSSENRRECFRNKSSFDSLACAHPHCQQSFPTIDDMISHLVSFHCQHQFRQRKLTFLSLEKYEAWKSSHEKMFAARMIEETDQEENEEGVIRLRYSCEYCDAWRRKSEKRDLSKEGKSMQVLVGCPAYFTVSISSHQSYIVVFGCFAHLGHRKRIQPGVVHSPDTLFQPNQWKISRVQCKYCLKCFVSHVAMNRHVKENHADPVLPKGTTIECGDPHCNVVCDRMSTLCEHVAHEHNRDDLVIEEFRFVNLQKFKSWKDQLETDTISKFVLSSSRTRVSGVIQSYYLCHLSGYANRSRHSVASTARLRTTKKLGRYCTAFINAKELPDGSVSVQCCLGHFGHGYDVRSLPLPNKVKEEVSELLLKGVDPRVVQNAVRKKYSPDERGYHLRRYEIRNISDNLRRRGLLLPKEKESVATTLSLLHTSRSETKSAQLNVGNSSNHLVRFQSVRSLPEERGRISRFSYARAKDSTDSNMTAKHSQNPSSRATAPHSTSEGLRDVSPPIIGTSGYIEFDEDEEYSNLDLVVVDEGDVGHSLTYLLTKLKIFKAHWILIPIEMSIVQKRNSKWHRC